MLKDKPLPESFTLDNILANFSTDEQARSFLEMWLWPNGPVCPRCNGTNPERVYKMTGKSGRPGLHNCKDCRRQFTVTVNTIFEDSHIPLRKWLVAWFLICSSKKGISSLQIQRILDLGSYRTALFMTHRIRHALKDTGAEKFTGIVEVDETVVGGREKREPWGTGGKTGHTNKMIMVSMIERSTGRKRSVAINRVTAAGLGAAIAENIEQGSTVNTDESNRYRKITADYVRKSVNHSRKEYARRENGELVTVNHCESSFSLFKRGVYGTFHSISKQHLHFYAAEFDHRWNHRKTTDGERAVEGLKMASGKRLTYKAIVPKETPAPK